MATEPRQRCRRTGFPRSGLLLALALALATGARPAAAEIRVTGNTEVRSIRFSGAHAVPERELRAVLRTRTRGKAFGLRSWLAKLPLISAPARHPFAPRVLQEDVVRLREKYFARGFLDTDIRYDVRTVGDEDLLDITFVIQEGRPQRVVEVTLAPADSGTTLPVPAEDRPAWAEVERRVQRLGRGRLDVEAVRAEADHVRSWWRNRGYPRAVVHGYLGRDSAAAEGRILITVKPGPRMRFGPVSIADQTTLSDDVVLRMLPFAPGDLYSERKLLDASEDLRQMELIRNAALEPGPALPPSDADADSLLPVTVSLTESKLRVVSGQVGYITDAGLSSEARWSHLNFVGGARVLTVSAVTHSGLLSFADDPDIRHRGSVSLLQPHVIGRRTSVVVDPFVEYRDDDFHRSTEVGTNVTLVHRRGPSLTGSLDYRIATRRIYEYRRGAVTAENTDLLTLLTQVAEGGWDSLGTRTTTSLVTLSASAGTLDDFANPTRGILVRPTLQRTAPDAWSSDHYWRADCVAYAFFPVTRRVVLAGRVAGGRLFPFGPSVPASQDDALISFLKLRDESFTAGGASDVRGWGYRMLGPKVPDIRFEEEGDSLRARTDGYVPVGGLSRASFSVELRLPIPGLGPSVRSHLFLDGGRVWTSDRRFSTDEDPYRQERVFYATGGGIDIATPVGAIRLSLGYKLNPSDFDLVDADDVLDALVAGNSATSGLPRHPSRRWHLHVAIGSSY